MGYLTYYNLEIRDEKGLLLCEEELEDIVNKIHLLANEEVFEEEYKGCALGEAKWYDWFKDMQKIAIRYPEYNFELSGEGEEKEDWWVALFKGPKSCVNYATPPSSEWT